MSGLSPLRAFVVLGAAALLGGAVAMGATALVGGFTGTTTTVVTEASPSSSQQSVASGQAMSIAEIYRRAAPGVVQITSTIKGSPSSFPGQFNSQAQQALGSGFVLDKAGHIITNYHVIEGADDIKVSFSNRDTVTARVVGSDPSTDLSVLRVNTPASALTPLPLGNSDRVEVGDQVVAIGNPFGLARTATAGIISAVQRNITSPNEFTIDHVLQTDAPINHGNSGGPLLSSSGQVIGVNTQIETGDPTGSATGNVGIGFAVPSNTVKNVAAQLLRNGKVEHAYLGIWGEAITSDLAQAYKLPVSSGILVTTVVRKTGAARAGLHAGHTHVVVAGETYVLGGDIIVSFNGTRISTLDQLRDAVAALEPGDKVKLVIYRGAKRTSVHVTLGRQPPSPQG